MFALTKEGEEILERLLAENEELVENLHRLVLASNAAFCDADYIRKGQCRAYPSQCVVVVEEKGSDGKWEVVLTLPLRDAITLSHARAYHRITELENNFEDLHPYLGCDEVRKNRVQKFVENADPDELAELTAKFVHPKLTKAALYSASVADKVSLDADSDDACP